MRYVVCYDIPETKRRTRLRKNLLSFGNPKQYSVFECDLSPREFERMKKAIKAIIDKEEDNVRIYPLCEKCLNYVEFFGGKPFEKAELLYIV
ncbi:MAG: CRISPR-associated endonuclease Cas2 [Pyrinomonadaceae bacterium]|jgi:CRISPR-associated protein Cas2|nr:CRISPR-associated endonuclease Cas2 [Pyrinomonadaceae bacterium]